MDISKAKEMLNKTFESKTKNKTNKSKSGIGWEIGAYSIRGLSVAIPAAVTMTLEDTWVKNGIGLLATMLIIAMLIIYKEPIKKASKYAPGVIPFAIFVVLAIFFETTSKALLTIGTSGLSGSVLAVPLHAKYLIIKKNTKSPELTALENIANTLK